LWLLFASVEIPQPPKSEVKDWLGVDLGLAAKLSAKGTRSVKRFLRKRRRKEERSRVRIFAGLQSISRT